MTRVSSEGPSFAKYQFSGIYHLKGGGDIHDWMKGVRLLTYMRDRVMEDIHYLLFIANMPSSRKVLLAMSEAIISRRGSKDGSNGGGSNPTFTLTSRTFTSNTSWVVPNHNGYISVRVFGGGGGGGGGAGVADGYNSGGGGGWMNNADLTLANGSSVYITIGAGGRYQVRDKYNTTGGTTSFGTWISANGGRGGNFDCGGSGGSGGGGGFGSGEGGQGFQFGGGGGGFTYGGDGGLGGIWGGNGGGSGLYRTNGFNGINTMGIGSIPANDRGPGVGGKHGSDYYNSYERDNYYGGGGGGGGYGANGGNGGNAPITGVSSQTGSGGGGGGWGQTGKGGDATNLYGGGGGGYGKGGNGGGGHGQYGGGGGGGGGNGGSGICIVQYYAAT